MACTGRQPDGTKPPEYQAGNGCPVPIDPAIVDDMLRNYELKGWPGPGHNGAYIGGASTYGCVPLSSLGPLHSMSTGDGTGFLANLGDDPDVRPTVSPKSRISYASTNRLSGNDGCTYFRHSFNYTWYDSNIFWFNTGGYWAVSGMSNTLYAIYHASSFTPGCPPGSVYNPLTGTCDAKPGWEWNPGCSCFEQVTPGIPSIPPEPPGVLPEPDSPDTIPGEPQNCYVIRCDLPTQVELIPDDIDSIVPPGYNSTLDLDPKQDPIDTICESTISEECITPDEGPV